MLQCKVCGATLIPMIDDHYVARDNEKQGISTVISCDEPKLYDAFDCPECGCQVIAQERKRKLFSILRETPDDEEDEEEEAEDEEDNDENC